VKCVATTIDPSTQYLRVTIVAAHDYMYDIVDDTTLSESISKGEPSRMDVNLTQLLDWSISNHVNVNVRRPRK